LLLAALPPTADAFFWTSLSAAGLWMLIPACWYLGGRWLGLDRLGALALGLFLPAARDWLDFGLGITSLARTGLYGQTWGIAFFPLAIGSLWRFAQLRKGSFALPLALTALCLLSHVFAGYLAVLAAAMLLLIRGSHSAAGRMLRIGGVLLFSAALTSFWLVPFLAGFKDQAPFPHEGEFKSGYPASEMLASFATGRFLDAGRLPWLTGLLAAGVVGGSVCRRGGAGGWLLLFGLLSGAMLLGPRSWGPGYRSLPLHGSFEVYRYMLGVQVAALYGAALGAQVLMRILAAGLARVHRIGVRRAPELVFPALLGLVVVAVGVSSWRAARVAAIEGVARSSVQALANVLSGHPGRFLCHDSLDSGEPALQTYLPILAGRPQVLSSSRGAHDTLSSYFLGNISLSPGNLSLFNVGHLVADQRKPALPAFLEPDGDAAGFRILRHRPQAGYFEGVRIPLRLAVARSAAAREAAATLSAALYPAGLLPDLGWHGAPGPEAWTVESDGTQFALHRDGKAVLVSPYPEVLADRVVRDVSPIPKSSVRILDEAVSPNRYRARVNVDRQEQFVLLKSSYHPYWEASVNGRLAGVRQVGPNLMAVAVPPGTNDVLFRYRNPWGQKAGAVAFLGAGAGAVVYAFMRRRRSEDLRAPERVS
jgi:hypothetical protein